MRWIHTHTLSYYCKRCSAVLLFLWRFSSGFPHETSTPQPTFSSSLWRVEIEKDIFVLFKKRFSLLCCRLHFFDKKRKKVKNRKTLDLHPVSPRVFIFFFLCVRFKNKHRRKEKDKTKRRARILLQQHTNTENVSHHRFISSRLRAHTLRETQHRRKRKRKRRKSKKRTPLILFVEGVETSSFESRKRW